MPKPIDRRVRRTRKALRDALMTLITEKGYDAITVQDITDEADLARATFYLHYRDKDELLSKSMEDVYDDLVARLEAHHPTESDAPLDLIAFRHVAEHTDFYHVIFGAQGVASFVLRLRHYMVKVARNTYAPVFVGQNPSLVDALLHQQAGALIGTISWWLENDMPHTPEQMAHLTHILGLVGCLPVLDGSQPVLSQAENGDSG